MNVARVLVPKMNVVMFNIFLKGVFLSQPVSVKMNCQLRWSFLRAQTLKVLF